LPESSQMPPPNSRAIVITEITAMGGAERACLALARWLYEHHLPAHILTYSDAIGLAQHATHPLKVVQLQPEMTARRKIQSLRAYFKARPQAPKPLMSGYQPALHATLAGLRGFHTLMHDTPSLFIGMHESASLKHRLARSLSDRITAHGLRSGGASIVTSSYLQAETSRVFGVHAAIARMGGLPGTHSFRPRALTGNTLRMLSVSRIESNKRIDWILRALASLEDPAHQSTPPLSTTVDWTLDITGRGSFLDEARTLARTLNLDRRVHFHGFVPDETLQQLYDTADLFLMPAVQGYGIPAIESLERGIPVLLHRDSGASDILLDTPWATVFTGGEPSFAPALELAITSLREGRHLNTPLPTIPTEDQWAEQVSQLCHWL
jgi:glycosyltransferase involved in cell wall biosynthesis